MMMEMVMVMLQRRGKFSRVNVQVALPNNVPHANIPHRTILLGTLG